MFKKAQSWVIFFKIRSEYNYFLSPDILSGRKDVTWDKVYFRPDIRQNFFGGKIKTSRVCVAPKIIWSYCTLINITLR